MDAWCAISNGCEIYWLSTISFIHKSAISGSVSKNIELVSENDLCLQLLPHFLRRLFLMVIKWNQKINKVAQVRIRLIATMAKPSPTGNSWGNGRPLGLQAACRFVNGWPMDMFSVPGLLQYKFEPQNRQSTGTNFHTLVVCSVVLVADFQSCSVSFTFQLNL